MTKERLLELREILFHLERKIAPLEWDNGRNQINEFKKATLTRLREEHQNASLELKQLEQVPAQELKGLEIPAEEPLLQKPL